MRRLNPSGHHVSTAALAPVLLFQGHHARRRTLKLPEAAGQRFGRCGEGPPLKVLILGDSAAAGVGSEHQQEALSGQLANNLCEYFEVAWTVFAKTGATTRSTLHDLHRLSSDKFDVVVTSLGVNDVTSGMTVRRWLSLQSELRSRLRDELGVRRMVVSGLPLMAIFPALPQPLRWHLGARAKLFNRKLGEDLVDQADCDFLKIDFFDNVDQLAIDGFHPGPKAYSVWGKLAADLIAKECS